MISLECVLVCGGKEQVSFSLTKDVAGIYSIDVNELTGSFTMMAGEAPATPPATPPEPSPPITSFNWLIVVGIICVMLIALLIIFPTTIRRIPVVVAKASTDRRITGRLSLTTVGGLSKRVLKAIAVVVRGRATGGIEVEPKLPVTQLPQAEQAEQAAEETRQAERKAERAAEDKTRRDAEEAK